MEFIALFALGALCLFGLALLIIIKFRNDTVYEFLTDVIFEHEMSVFDNMPSYQSMMYDFRCWTYDQFVRKYLKRS